MYDIGAIKTMRPNSANKCNKYCETKQLYDNYDIHRIRGTKDLETSHLHEVSEVMGWKGCKAKQL